MQHDLTLSSEAMFPTITVLLVQQCLVGNVLITAER